MKRTLSYLRALALVAVLAVSACGGGGSPAHTTVTVTKTPPAPTPKTLTVTGVMNVDTAGGYITDWHGKRCSAASGYDDIGAGVAVVVSNPAGVKVAIGSLGRGELSNEYTCSFPFTVDDVPDKWSVYSIEVGHRGNVDYSRSDLDSPVTLTLQKN